MRKLKLLSLFAAMLFATSMWAAEMEGPWTYLAMKHGACPKNEYNSNSYNGLGNNGTWGDITFWNDGDGIGFTQKGSSPGGTRKQGVFSVYYIDRNVESYSKQVLTWKFKLNTLSTKHHGQTALYAVQGGQSNAYGLTVDFTDDLSNGAGSNNRIASYRNTAQDGQKYSGAELTKTFEFNNYQGNAQATKSWCLLLTHTISCGSSGKDGLHEWGSFYSVSASWATTYYSTISFNANGGQGTMSSMSDKSGTFNLTANGFSKTGYSFAGWATSNSGAVAYANGASYTVNQSNRGPKTLYAKWTANKYTVTLDLQGGQTGSASVEATYDAAMPAMTVPTRKGFTFAGYYDAVTGGTKYYNADGSSAKNWNKASNTTLYAHWAIDPNTTVLYLDSLNNTLDQEVAAFNRPEAPEVEGFTFLYWIVKEAPLSEGIELHAFYKANNPATAPKKQTVGKFTMVRAGEENKYILELTK